ncbi:Tn3 family transposase [Streptomyces sp. QL37]|uniref:transposase n=1 Tax=Streptomyces sp. QL37 TaxID=2093747 RepID=UPI001C9E35D1
MTRLRLQAHGSVGQGGDEVLWHVETKSLCVYSQLKSCSASEVAAVIEGVLRHCTDVEIDRRYTDTHGASIVGFAFAHMLGFNLLPRLKNVGSARLYRPAAGADEKWPHLAPVHVNTLLLQDILSEEKWQTGSPTPTGGLYPRCSGPT